MDAGFFLPAKQLRQAPRATGRTPCPRTLALCSQREARDHLSYQNALSHKVLPLAIHLRGQSELVTVATPVQKSPESCAAFRFLFGRDVELLHIEESIISEAIFRAYCGDERTFSQLALQTFTSEKGEHSGKKTERFAHDLLFYSVAKDATDIHIVPEPGGGRLELRIRGQLYIQDDPPLPLGLQESLVRWFKVQSQLSPGATLKPQDGAFHFTLPHCVQRVRTSVMPTVHGEKVVLRLLRMGGNRQIEELSFPSIVQNHLLSALALREGLILLAGPTGGGKTTTLYAAMRHLAGVGKSLVSVEDPVEAVIPGVAQTNLHVKQGVTHEAFLRGALRQDPDVVMLGEIRDAGCAQALLDASFTGHLTLSSIHGGSIEGTIRRFIRFGIPLVDLLRSTRLIIVQHLQPILCQKCKTLDLQGSAHVKSEVFRRVGCIACDYSGYDGLIPVVESLCLTNSVCHHLANKGYSAEALRQLPENVYYSPIHQKIELLKSGTLGWEDYCRTEVA